MTNKSKSKPAVIYIDSTYWAPSGAILCGLIVGLAAGFAVPNLIRLYIDPGDITLPFIVASGHGVAVGICAMIMLQNSFYRILGLIFPAVAAAGLTFYAPRAPAEYQFCVMFILPTALLGFIAGVAKLHPDGQGIGAGLIAGIFGGIFASIPFFLFRFFEKESFSLMFLVSIAGASMISQTCISITMDLIPDPLPPGMNS